MGWLIGILSGALEYLKFFYVSELGLELNNFSQIPIL